MKQFPLTLFNMYVYNFVIWHRCINIYQLLENKNTRNTFRNIILVDITIIKESFCLIVQGLQTTFTVPEQDQTAVSVPVIRGDNVRPSVCGQCSWGHHGHHHWKEL